MKWLLTTLFLPLSLGNYLSNFFDMDYNIFLDEEEKVSFHWTLINDTHMEIGVVCLNLGWCAIGISPGQMPGSDINFFWVDDSDSQLYLQDRYASSRSVPVYDDEQDVYLLSGGQTDNVTWVKYIRPQFSCDSQDNTIEIGTTRLCYAYHSNDPTEEYFDSTSSVDRHSNKGTKSVNLLSGTGYTVDLENDTISVDLTVDSYSVPDDDTTYYCKLFKLPETKEKQHIVKFEPIVTEGNEGLVHHMLLYYCPTSSVDVSDIGTERDCNEYAEMGIASSDCVYGTVSYSWAIGGEDFYLPEGVGIEMSGNETFDGTELQYVLLEIHYDNPDELDTFTDSSGVRITYTPTLRNESAGMIEIGIEVNNNQFIPHGISATLNSGYCLSDCTEAGLPDSGVKLFASMLHAHTAGIGLNLRHVRNGIELDPIDTNWAYDFNYQNLVSITEPMVDLLPGDDLILDCYYNTTDRDDTIVGGLSTEDEMCLVYVYVYPKPDLRECMTELIYSDIVSWFNIADEKGYADGWTYNADVSGAKAYYNSLLTNYTTRDQKCDDEFRNDLLSGSNELEIPTITSEYDWTVCGESMVIQLDVGSDSDSSDGDDDIAINSKNVSIFGMILVFFCLFFLLD